MNTANNKYTSFLKWVGGKNWLVPQISNFLPPRFNDYHEPFLGSGAIFFAVGVGKRAFLSDSNQDLINAFIQVRDNPAKVIRYLSQMVNAEEHYYRIRGTLPRGKIQRAARFIYLNKASYNGVYRVSRDGVFNVPYGHRPSAPTCEPEKIKAVSKAIRYNVVITSCDFEETLPNLKKGDLVFLDPPYTVTHGNNSFIEYNKKLFSWEDQQRLAVFIEKLASRGIYFILTNAPHQSIRELYGHLGNVFQLQRQNGITSVIEKRGRTDEIVITNCR